MLVICLLDFICGQHYCCEGTEAHASTLNFCSSRVVAVTARKWISCLQTPQVLLPGALHCVLHIVKNSELSSTIASWDRTLINAKVLASTAHHHHQKVWSKPVTDMYTLLSLTLDSTLKLCTELVQSPDHEGTHSTWTICRFCNFLSYFASVIEANQCSSARGSSGQIINKQFTILQHWENCLY